MARPIGTKNVMRSPGEKVIILNEFYASSMNASLICKKYHIAQSSLRKWRDQFECGGITALASKTGFSTGEEKGRPKNSPDEALKRKIRDLEIEVARLKKGYLVKGGGQKKVFVTSLDQNIK